jgi:Putative zinc-finger
MGVPLARPHERARTRPLTCSEAALAASRDLDGRLSARERLLLRSHLGGCKQCACFDRALSIQRVALRRLTVVALPATLRSFDRKLRRAAASHG